MYLEVSRIPTESMQSTNTHQRWTKQGQAREFDKKKRENLMKLKQLEDGVIDILSSFFDDCPLESFDFVIFNIFNIY